MTRLGVTARREEFLTAVEATVHYLRTSRPAGEAYFAVGTASFCRQLRQAGFDIRETPDDDVGAVLVGFDTELTYRKVEDACRLLCRGWISSPPIRIWPAPPCTASCRTAGPSAPCCGAPRAGSPTTSESQTPP